MPSAIPTHKSQTSTYHKKKGFILRCHASIVFGRLKAKHHSQTRSDIVRYRENEGQVCLKLKHEQQHNRSAAQQIVCAKYPIHMLPEKHYRNVKVCTNRQGSSSSVLIHANATTHGTKIIQGGFSQRESVNIR